LFNKRIDYFFNTVAMKMKTSAFVKLIGASSLIAILAGCQTLPSPPSEAPPETSPPSVPLSRARSINGDNPSQYTTAAERNFAEGLDFYDKGDYAAAIKKFRSSELTNAWPELRVRALKYLAFSYCVIDNLDACQQVFYDAIQLDPKFKLLPAEEGHPIWGPVYQKAKLGPPDHAASPVKVKEPHKKSRRSSTTSSLQ
jgi:hypothetical protein